MITTKNPFAVGWKHNHIEGIETKQKDDVFEIIKWPDSLPALVQTDVDAWELEFLARDIKDEKVTNTFKDMKILSVLIDVINEGILIPGANKSKGELRKIIKDRL